MRYLLDTTFVIDYLRGERAAIDRFVRFFDEGDEPMVNEIVVCEAATGAPGHPDPDLTAMLEPIEFIQPGPEQPCYEPGSGVPRHEAHGRHLSLADA